MSLTSYELFNIWFPSLVGALVIGLVVAALWEFRRRKFWRFVSRFRPSILVEVGLDSQYQSRAEAEDHHREIIEKMNIFARVLNLLVSPELSNSGATTAFDIEAQTEINPHHATPVIRMTGTSAYQGTYSTSSSSQNHLYPGETIHGMDCRPIDINFTSYFPDGTSKDVTRPAKRLYRKYANGPMKRIKSSIILQASIVMGSWVLAEIVELAKHCMQKENKCIFQLGNWAILYYNAGEVQLHLLKEGDVPVNIEARWQDGKTGITMRGLYLTGSQIKVGTKRTSKILRSAGPATQGAGGFDELHLRTGEFDDPGEESLIYASKVVVVDGVSLIVRSEASFILPPREKNVLIEAAWTRWLWISNSAKMLRSLLFGAEDCQPECAANRPALEFDPEQLELSVEHWKGLSEIELLNARKEVLLYLQEQGESGIVENVGPPSPHSHLIFVRDAHYLEYWQEGLRVLNEVINRNSSDSHSHTHVRVRGSIQFLLGDFESALQDHDLAHLNTGGHQSTVLLDRALVKCMLGRYSEAMGDVVAVMTLNPKVNDIQELEACIQQILQRQRFIQIVTQSRPSCQRRSLLPDQDNFVVRIPDLLTGDEWHSGEIGSLHPISGAGTARESMGVSRAADWSTTSIAEAFKLQLQLTNYAQSLEMNPRYHVRRISFIITLLEDECDPNDVVKTLREDQELLNWQAPTEDLQNDLQVRETLFSLSRKLLPHKNISHTLHSIVTDDDSCFQRTGPHPLSRNRHVSCRSAMLTKHSAADGDVQTLFLHDGTAGDRSCWRRRSHEYIKLLVLPEARSPYRAFWLVQWDVVDMWQVSSDGQGNSDRGLCSNPAAVEGKDINKKQFCGIRLSEIRNSPWIAEVAGADGNGPNRHRYASHKFRFDEEIDTCCAFYSGSDARKTPRMGISVNEKPQTSRQSSSDAEEVRAPDTGKKGGSKIAPRRRLAPLPKFKRKLCFGTYEPEDVDCAKDAVNCYMGSNLSYHFSDSPSTFATEWGDPDRGLCSNPAAVERQDVLREFHSVRSPWTAKVVAAVTSSSTSDGNGLNGQRCSDARTNPRMSIPVNEKPETSLQTQPFRASGVDSVFITISENSTPGGDSTMDSSSMNAYKRKSVDNFHYYNGDEEAASGVLRSADTHRISEECNQKDETQELEIENGLQVAVKRGSYHDLSRSMIEKESAALAELTRPSRCAFFSDDLTDFVNAPRNSVVMELIELDLADDLSGSMIEQESAVKRGLNHDLSRSMVEQESAALAGLTHPNICKFLRTSRRGLPVVNHDLPSILDSRLKGLPEGSSPSSCQVAIADIALQLVRDIIVSLRHPNVADLDLKPQNILLTPLHPLAESGSAFRPGYYCSVELSDFELARSQIQSSTLMAGTSRYKAPEMLEVRGSQWMADVYSFGIVCCEILGGNLPFEEYRHHCSSLHASRPLAHLHLPDVPEALKKLIHQCLDSNPAQRPTFDHIVKKLRECKVQAHKDTYGGLGTAGPIPGGLSTSLLHNVHIENSTIEVVTKRDDLCLF